MSRTFWVVALGLALAGAAALAVVMRTAPPPVPLFKVRPNSAAVSAPGLCPWRTPSADMAALFPGSTREERHVLFLSGLLTPLQHRLGLGSPIDDNSLYVYHVLRGSKDMGSVLIKRASGEYGAIEVVVGVGRDGKIRGVRLQRYREPDTIASAIASPSWLNQFRGKSASSALKLGSDISQVRPVARKSAMVVVQAVRTLTIELDVARGEESG